MQVCWNAIVRNEAARITRCMLSLIDHIDCAVILDTGSTDNTVDLIEEFFATHRKPVEIYFTEFENFEQSRNHALGRARRAALEFDTLLLCDADMELVGSIPEIKGVAAQVMQKAGSLEYYNTRLLRRDVPARYIGVTHEYLSVEGFQDQVPGDRMHFIDHADGANRADKFQRDIRLLHKAIDKEPTNERYWFYLAQSHRDAGEWAEALTAYKKRVSLGGWPEEVWNAQVNVAHCLKNLGDENGFILELLKAYNLRPQRAEAIHDLANHYRNKGDNNLAAMFAKVVQDTPRPNDVLFVSDYVYRVGGDEEMSIAGYYNPALRAEAFCACDRVASGSHPYDSARQLARANLFHYLSPADRTMGTFASKEIDFHVDGWNALNPSVCRVNDALYCIVRTVNYVITPDGRYDIDGKGSAISADNPIRTRNYLVRLDNDLNVISSDEIIAPSSGKWPLVLGWEDMRLFEYKGGLAVSATVREANAAGFCKQWFGELLRSGDNMHVVNERELPSAQDTEKNWMPIVGQDAWMYNLGVVVHLDGHAERKRCNIPSHDYRGSSQVIPWGVTDGRLAIVHEAVHHDGQRIYWHRFVLFDKDLNYVSKSLPFVFQDKQIEFCAGMAAHPDGQRIVISYGVKDKEARLATVHSNDVVRMLLWDGREI